MIIIDVPQGSTDWFIHRLYRLTGSDMKRNITSTGKCSKSEAAIKAIDKLIAGIDLANLLITKKDEIGDLDDYEFNKFMSEFTGEKFTGNRHTERGKENEADIIANLSELIGSQVQDVGMVVKGNAPTGVVSCSPDGLIYEGGKLVAGAEVKSPCYCNYIGHVASGVLPDDYKLQVHSGMIICEVDTWHFGSYFRDKPLYHQVVKRDSFTDNLEKGIEDFKLLYQERYERVMDAMEKLGVKK